MDGKLNPSRRERQILDILYAHGSLTAHEIMTKLPDKPSYSSVRMRLRVMEQKQYVSHFQNGKQFVYKPTYEKSNLREVEAKRFRDVFADGSVEKAVLGILNAAEIRMSNAELTQLRKLIDQAKRRKE